MDNYYYCISQLPMLFFESEAFPTIVNFLQETEKWLSPVDYAVLSRADMDDVNLDGKGPEVVQKYKEFEFDLRGDLALWRANREHRTASFPLSLITEGTPLEIERNLLKLRWDFVEEMETGHHFDLEALVLFFLKLQILRRLSRFEKEKGLVAFQRLCEVEI